MGQKQQLSKQMWDLGIPEFFTNADDNSIDRTSGL